MDQQPYDDIWNQVTSDPRWAGLTSGQQTAKVANFARKEVAPYGAPYVKDFLSRAIPAPQPTADANVSPLEQARDITRGTVAGVLQPVEQVEDAALTATGRAIPAAKPVTDYLQQDIGGQPDTALGKGAKAVGNLGGQVGEYELGGPLLEAAGPLASVPGIAARAGLGAGIEGGTSAAQQYNDTGKIDLGQTAKAAAIGGAALPATELGLVAAGKLGGKLLGKLSSSKALPEAQEGAVAPAEAESPQVPTQNAPGANAEGPVSPTAAERQSVPEQEQTTPFPAQNVENVPDGKTQLGIPGVGKDVSVEAQPRPGRMSVNPDFPEGSPEHQAVKQQERTNAIEQGIYPPRAEPFSEFQQAAEQIPVGQLLAKDPEKIGRNEDFLSRAETNAARGHLQNSTISLESTSAALSKAIADGDDAAVSAIQDKWNYLDGATKKLADLVYTARSEAGRTLNALKATASQTLDPNYWLLKAAQMKGGVLDTVEHTRIMKLLMEARNERDAALAKASAPGGEPAATDAASAGGAQPPGGPVVPGGAGGVGSKIPVPPAGPAQQALVRQVMKLRKTTGVNAAAGVVKAGLLTGLHTMSQKIAASNAVAGGMEEASRGAGGAVDSLLSALSGQRTLQGTNIGAMGRAAYAGATTGLKEAGQILKSGVSDEQAQGLNFKHEFNTGVGPLDFYVNGVMRWHNAVQQPFWRAGYERSIEEQAWLQAKNAGAKGSDLKQLQQQLIANPTAEMQAEAMAQGDFAVFRSPNQASKWIEDMHAGKNGVGMQTASQMLVPFSRTPANLLARIFSYAGLGIPVRAIQAVTQGLTPEIQRALALSIGRGAVGVPIMTLGYFMGKAGMASGIRPASAGERGLAEQTGQEDSAVKPFGPYSPLWVQLKDAQPFGPLLAAGATMAQREGGITDAPVIAARTVADLPMLQSASNAIDTLKEGGNVGSFAGKELGMAVPTAVADAASLGDSYQRNARGFGGEIANKIPGLRNTLPYAQTPLGEYIPNNPINTLTPFHVSTDQTFSDPQSAALQQYDVPVSVPSDTYRASGGKVHMSPEQFAQFTADQGQAARGALTAAQNTGRYIYGDDETRRAILERAIREARAVSRQKIARGY